MILGMYCGNIFVHLLRFAAVTVWCNQMVTVWKMKLFESYNFWTNDLILILKTPPCPHSCQAKVIFASKRVVHGKARFPTVTIWLLHTLQKLIFFPDFRLKCCDFYKESYLSKRGKRRQGPCPQNMPNIRIIKLPKFIPFFVWPMF